MEKIKNLLLLLVSFTLLGGCASSGQQLIKSATSVQRTDVFQEITTPGTTPAGYADLTITSSLKTPKAGFHLIQTTRQGTGEYQLLVNVDGQPINIKGSLSKENTEVKYGDPESGEGTRYRFSKILRLKSGAHHVVVALPDDSVVKERNITLTEGVNSMVLEPVYKSGGSGLGQSYRRERFYEGVKELRVLLNGSVI